MLVRPGRRENRKKQAFCKNRHCVWKPWNSNMSKYLCLVVFKIFLITAREPGLETQHDTNIVGHDCYIDVTLRWAGYRDIKLPKNSNTISWRREARSHSSDKMRRTIWWSLRWSKVERRKRERWGGGGGLTLLTTTSRFLCNTRRTKARVGNTSTSWQQRMKWEMTKLVIWEVLGKKAERRFTRSSD